MSDSLDSSILFYDCFLVASNELCDFIEVIFSFVLLPEGYAEL